MHYETLKLYESLGLKITKIYRGIKFEESAWLEKYINLNTKLRIEANNFEVDFFKLMNNFVFGKTLENIRNRVDIRLLSSDKKGKNWQPSQTMIAVRSSMKPRCCSYEKTKLYFNKPVYLDMSILDLSKSLMDDFHYNYIKTKYGDKAKLLFIDTNSLAHEITTKDFLQRYQSRH